LLITDKDVSSYDKIWKVVSQIPYGRVATYGQIAELAGLEGNARLAGYAMHAVKPERKLPWHRVINSQGRISLIGPSAKRQRKLLEAEGIEFSPSGRIALKKFGWQKSTPRSLR
jgi:methylated-DNA-protein-cysteine methyltransferase-like protein